MDLQGIRSEIDQIDAQLVELFARRMEVAGQVAAYKQQHNLPVLDKAREREVLMRVSELAGEPIEGYARVLYTTLFAVSRAYQHALLKPSTVLSDSINAAISKTPPLFPQKGVVACQGIEGAYSQMACDRLFPAANILYFSSFEGVFAAVEKGLCQFGMLPIENSSHGSVGSVYDLMRSHHFSIVRSVKMLISHALLAKPGASLGDIREVFSHEQAVGQCSQFLAANPGMKVTVVENTAVAAQMVASSDRQDVAAISSRPCAALYGLSELSCRVQNSDHNYTRFICIAKDLAIYPGANRVSLMLHIPHRPGALYELIARFAVHGFNLTKLESRPILGSNFEFMFYFDLEASVAAPETMRLLDAIASENDSVVFLGNYLEVV